MITDHLPTSIEPEVLDALRERAPLRKPCHITKGAPDAPPYCDTHSSSTFGSQCEAKIIAAQEA